MPYITDTTPVYFIFTFAAFKLLESRNTAESVCATFLFLFGWWPEEVWSIWSYQNNMINKKKTWFHQKFPTSVMEDINLHSHGYTLHTEESAQPQFVWLLIVD